MNEQKLQHLYSSKIIPVIRADSSDLALKVIRVLEEVGFKTVEITLTIPNALKVIEEVSRKSKVYVGAGTIRSMDDALRCIDAGAEYIVSPYIIEGLPEICKKNNVYCMMSGLTPTEITKAWQLGSDAVKIFPVSSVGGSSFIKSVKTVYPEIPLLPTGGVNLGNMNQFFDAGASFVGVGSDLVNTELLKKNKEKEFRELCTKYLEKLNYK